MKHLEVLEAIPGLCCLSKVAEFHDSWMTWRLSSHRENEAQRMDATHPILHSKHLAETGQKTEVLSQSLGSGSVVLKHFGAMSP